MAAARPEATVVEVRPSPSDEYWMRRALACAERARDAGEVPVGAVLIRAGVELAAGWNAPIGRHDPTAHAEIRVLRRAAAAAGNYRLPGSTLYVTLEPCVMCAGAIVQARVGRVVYAAPDPRAGAAGSVYDVLTAGRLNHRPLCEGGLCGEQAAALLRAFFRSRRSEVSRDGA